MSSPPPFVASSPLSITSPRRSRKSKFTYKHFSQLKGFSTSTLLRIIAHVDLDAFYAQCETVRLGIDPSKPLAVQQWQGLIAINYPARAFGLNRHITSTEALKLCPDLILQHVATWKEGDDKWAYREDNDRNIATHKVSLDPYRMQSRKILQCIKEFLPEKEQRVEKASIDEVFLDLSAQIHGIMMARYPELRGPPPYDDPTERLPRPPTTALDWEADALVDLDDGESEDSDPDWDDVAMCIGSEIIRGVRKQIKEKLGYTCSGGVARNKMLAKLGSGHKKPNQQTIIRNRAIQHFLSGFKFTKIRNLGGKLGDEVVAMFNTDTVKDLLDQPLEQLTRLGDDTGSWLYSTIRGEDNSEVNPRTQIKSMLSAKSFRPAINSFEQGVRWLRIFAADIFSRCVEEGVLEHKRRPKTINLHHRQGAQTRSRSSPIPQGKTLTEEMLFDLAKNLLAQVVVDGRAWPCLNLSLSVGGFEDGVTNNKGIGGFLVRGEEAKAIKANERHGTEPLNERSGARRPSKRRRLDSEGIQKFFVPKESSRSDAEAGPSTAHIPRQEDSVNHGAELEDEDDESDAFEPLPKEQSALHSNRPHTPLPDESDNDDLYNNATPPSAQPQPKSSYSPLRSPSYQPDEPKPHPQLQQRSIETYFCTRCSADLPLDGKSEHEDWHFAKDLAKEIREAERNDVSARKTPVPQKPVQKPPQRGKGRPPGGGMGRGAGREKGQRQLAFGKG